MATGSGSLHAGTVVKVGYRDGIDRDAGDRPRLPALWEAADADSATGGPGRVAGHLPDRRHDHAAGFARVDDDELAERYQSTDDPPGAPGERARPGRRRRGLPDLAMERALLAAPALRLRSMQGIA